MNFKQLKIYPYRGMNFKQMKIYPYRNAGLTKSGEVGEILAPNLAEVAFPLLRSGWNSRPNLAEVTLPQLQSKIEVALLLSCKQSTAQWPMYNGIDSLFCRRVRINNKNNVFHSFFQTRKSLVRHFLCLLFVIM